MIHDRARTRRAMSVLALAGALVGVLAPAVAADESTWPGEALSRSHPPVDDHTGARAYDLGQPACTPGALVHNVATTEPVVALTFDDGPWPTNTRAVMDALRDHGYEGKATFYMVGVNVRQNPSVAQEVVARGYDIGNHTMTHALDAQRIANEIRPAQDLIESVTGLRPDTVRSPGLVQGAVIQQELARQGLCNVFTRIDIGDWRSPRISAGEICARIRAGVRPGDIILLHDAGGHGPTVQAMQTCVIETLHSLGLSVVSEQELLNGRSGPDGRVPAGGVLEIQAGSVGGQSVVGQLTVDGAKAPGYLTAFPCDESRPLASDLNYVAAVATTNLLITRTDSTGRICVFSSATAHVIYDQVAEVDAATLPLGTAQRLLDTREGAKVAAGAVVQVRAAAPDQIVIGQLTSDRADGAGYVTAYPCLEGPTATSDLNVAPGQVTSNRLIARADAAGDICLFTYSATHLIYDQVAAVDASALTLGTVERLVDTRSSVPIAAGGTLTLPMGDAGAAVIAQVTTDRSSASGYLTVYPCDQGRPEASNLNFTPTRARSGRIVVQADGDGNACVFSYAATDVIVDRSGWAPWPSHAPMRLADTRSVALA